MARSWWSTIQQNPDAGRVPSSNFSGLKVLGRATSDVVVGLGVIHPFGLGIEYDRAWFGRYDSVKSDLLTVNFGPAVSVQVTDWLSLGGGIDIQYADTTLEVALPNTFNPGGPYAGN